MSESDKPATEGFLVSREFLEHQGKINSIVRGEFAYGREDKPEPMRGPKRADVRLVRTPAAGIKGMQESSLKVYGAECEIIEVYDGGSMTTVEGKKERRLRYRTVAGGGVKAKQLVMNLSVNPVPGYQLLAVDQSVSGDYVFADQVFELPAIVIDDFEEAETYAEPVVVPVFVLAMTGDNTIEDPETQTPVVTDYEIKVVTRGKGTGLEKGTPCRIRTVAGAWVFSWVDCSPDDELAEGVDDPQPYPDPFEVV